MPNDRAASAPPPRSGWIAAAVAALALVAFQPALDLGFVDFDDPLYVTANPQVQRGLDAESIRWAMTSSVASNWHPVTMLSHMTDVELFGANARGHHLTSVAIHALNAALVFLVLFGMTGAAGPSLLVAALFAVHPTRVESVAWVSERKDVLSTLFWLLATAAYVRYVRKPGELRYVVVAVLLAVGLAAKAMLVTLPFVFLLLDVWPLRRVPAPIGRQTWRPVAGLIAEKIPFFALSACAAWVAVATQGGAIAQVEARPFVSRLANAVVAYAGYIGDLLWPSGLAAFYPFGDVSLTRAAAAGMVLAAVTVAAGLAWRRAPYLIVGWLWFLGTLVPVIGLLAVGGQARADRYTYVPAIGLFVMVAWGGAALVRRRPKLRPPLIVASGLAIIALVPVTRAQIRTWQDTETLFRRAIAVTEGNDLAHLNLAEVLRARGTPEEAIEHYRAAIAIAPETASHHAALGSALDGWGRHAEALQHFERALALDDTDPIFHQAMAQALDSLGRIEEAVEHLEQTVALDPTFVRAHHGLGVLYARLGDPARAIRHLEEALRLDPTLPLERRIEDLRRIPD